MNSHEFSWKPLDRAAADLPPEPEADLVLFLGARDMQSDRACVARLRCVFPGAIITGRSGGGPISGAGVERLNQTMTLLPLSELAA